MVTLSTGLEAVVSMIDSNQPASLVKIVSTSLSSSKNLVFIGKSYYWMDIAEFIDTAEKLVGLHQLVSSGDLANARTVANFMLDDIPAFVS